MKEKSILLIGSGGREHALSVALANSGRVFLHAVPGNPGIAKLAETHNLNLKDHSQVVNFCKLNAIDLVVIGPEQPLADGLSDSLRKANIAVFGPSKQAAMLESSKEYAKNFMRKYIIPTASYMTFSKENLSDAIKYIERQNLPIVIKADGLAAGKGVVIAQTKEEAVDSLISIFEGEFGDAGSKVVIEDFMQGEEASIFAVCDGADYITLAPAQDHKRALDGDLGKNTGGMGAYAPAPIVTDSLLKKVKEKILDPTIEGMNQEGSPYIGCLYVGLMIHNDEPKVVEYNCRFGDPETQPVLSIFKGDFAELLYSAAIGKIDKSTIIDIASGKAACVVLASQGYPDSFESGFKISGLNLLPDDVIAYVAGAKDEAGAVASTGGRVLGITGLGENLKEAIENAYKGVDIVDFENKYYRKDIGAKGLKKQ